MSCPIASKTSELSVDGITLDLANNRLIRGQRPQRLTPMESRLLAVFMSNPGRVLTRQFLMREVWETDFCEDTRTLEVHVCWLRKKLGDNPASPRYLHTVRGRGYRFGPEQKSSANATYH